MHAINQVTQEGQITIPPELQERYGLKPGTTFEFASKASALTVRPRRVFDLERARTVLGSASKELEGKTVEEWLEWFRGPVELPPDDTRGR